MDCQGVVSTEIKGNASWCRAFMRRRRWNDWNLAANECGVTPRQSDKYQPRTLPAESRHGTGWALFIRTNGQVVKR